MSTPHYPACPCLRCNARRKAEAASIKTLVANSSVGRALADLKKNPHRFMPPPKRMGYDGLSTVPTTCAPAGPPTSELLDWARQRRREERAKERDTR